MVDNLMLDPRFQYALHTTSFEEQPLSDKSLSRFRARCYDYETTHNVDLYRNCVKGLSASIAKMMKIDGRIRRMDSTMIEANIRKLSRMELIYTCISKLVKYMDKTSAEFDHTKVLACPAGHEPKSCNFNQKTEQCLLSFDRNHCVNCPFQAQCKPKIFKRVAKKAVSKKSAMRAKYIEQKSTEKFKLLAKLRNGAETIPSLLKNKYDVNKMPVRGLQRSKFFFGSKVCAINFNKLFDSDTARGIMPKIQYLHRKLGKGTLVSVKKPSNYDIIWHFMKFSRCIWNWLHHVSGGFDHHIINIAINNKGRLYKSANCKNRLAFTLILSAVKKSLSM